MRVEDDTGEEELAAWAIPALILSEDEPGTELDKEHHSRAARLNQRLAAAAKSDWGGR